jgi:Na+/proline symporter
VVPSWLALGAALVYISALFWIASYGDRRALATAGAPAAPDALCAGAGDLLHKLDLLRLGGLAAVSGLDFLTIYIGPILILTLGAPLLRHIIALSKAERITSVADFLSARYGKNERVAGLAAMIAVVGVVPYIACN